MDYKHYHWADVESNGGKVAWQHAEEVETMSQPVDIPTYDLLSITTSHFSFKKWDLVKPHISTFSNLDIFMMSDISTS